MKKNVMKTIGLLFVLALSHAAMAGSHALVSGRVTVDTRNTGGGPTVGDVISQYCDSSRHVFYLDGVSLPQTFRVSPNWNGKTPGVIIFTTPKGTFTGTSATRMFDMGSDFGVTTEKPLWVRLRASDNTESPPYPVNFHVIPPPMGIPAGILIVPFSADELKYTLPPIGVNWDFFDAMGMPVDEIPGFGGKAMGILSSVDASLEVKGDGTAQGGLLIDVDGKKKISKGKNKTERTKVNVAGVELKPEIAIAPEWRWTNSAWELTGSAALGLHASATIPPKPTPPPYIWALPPIYVRGEVDFHGDAGLIIRGWNAAGHPDLNGILQLDGIATFIAGCGLAYVAAVEGSLGGGPEFEFQFPNEPLVLKLGLKIEGDIKVIFLVLEAELIHKEYTWWMVGGDGKQKMPMGYETAELARLLNRPDPRKFKQISRAYLERRARRTRALLQEVAESGVLALDTFPYSAPTLALCATNRMLLWLNDNSTRIAENRTQLVWQNWRGTNWSMAQAVCDDGRADYSPCVAFLPNGQSLAAWQKERIVLTNGAMLDEMLANSEIFVGLFNPALGTWSCTNMTNNGILDQAPRLVAAPNGSALLVWSQNASNNLLGGATMPNALCFARWKNELWSPPGFVATNMGMITWTSLAYNGTQGVLALSINIDNDMATVTNEEIFASVFNGDSWGPLRQLTTNSVQDTNPQVNYDAQGRLGFVWYHASNLVMRLGDLNLTSPAAIGEPGCGSSAKDFRMIVGDAGQLSIIWEDTANDRPGHDPFLINFDPALNVWSRPVALLNTSNYFERSFSGAYTTNGSLLMAYNRVAISYDTNHVPQFGEVDLMCQEFEIGHDLGSLVGDLTAVPSDVMCGQTSQVSVLVRNLGELAASNVCVRFYNGAITNSGQIGSNQWIALLPAGSNVSMGIRWLVPQTSTAVRVYAVIDPDAVQNDRNRANNARWISILAPDLVVDSTMAQCALSNHYIVSAQVLNAGALPVTTAFDVVFKADSPTGTVLATVSIPALAVTGAYNAAFEWDLSGVAEPSFSKLVYYQVDPSNLVVETSKDNNSGMMQIVGTSNIPEPATPLLAIILYCCGWRKHTALRGAWRKL